MDHHTHTHTHTRTPPHACALCPPRAARQPAGPHPPQPLCRLQPGWVGGRAGGWAAATASARAHACSCCSAPLQRAAPPPPRTNNPPHVATPGPRALAFNPAENAVLVQVRGCVHACVRACVRTRPPCRPPSTPPAHADRRGWRLVRALHHPQGGQPRHGPGERTCAPAFHARGGSRSLAASLPIGLPRMRHASSKHAHTHACSRTHAP